MVKKSRRWNCIRERRWAWDISAIDAQVRDSEGYSRGEPALTRKEDIKGTRLRSGKNDVEAA